jgi:phosphoglucomutase
MCVWFLVSLFLRELRVFTGNEIGIMLGSWVWTEYQKKNPDVDPSKCCMLNTTVSSKMLSAMAAKEGIYYEVSLSVRSLSSLLNS